MKDVTPGALLDICEEALTDLEEGFDALVERYHQSDPTVRLFIEKVAAWYVEEPQSLWLWRIFKDFISPEPTAFFKDLNHLLKSLREDGYFRVEWTISVMEDDKVKHVRVDREDPRARPQVKLGSKHGGSQSVQELIDLMAEVERREAAKANA